MLKSTVDISIYKTIFFSTYLDFCRTSSFRNISMTFLLFSYVESRKPILANLLKFRSISATAISDIKAPHTYRYNKALI